MKYSICMDIETSCRKRCNVNYSFANYMRTLEMFLCSSISTDTFLNRYGGLFVYRRGDVSGKGSSGCSFFRPSSGGGSVNLVCQ